MSHKSINISSFKPIKALYENLNILKEYQIETNNYLSEIIQENFYHDWDIFTTISNQKYDDMDADYFPSKIKNFYVADSNMIPIEFQPILRTIIAFHNPTKQILDTLFANDWKQILDYACENQEVIINKYIKIIENPLKFLDEYKIYLLKKFIESNKEKFDMLQWKPKACYTLFLAYKIVEKSLSIVEKFENSDATNLNSKYSIIKSTKRIRKNKENKKDKINENKTLANIISVQNLNDDELDQNFERCKKLDIGAKKRSRKSIKITRCQAKNNGRKSVNISKRRTTMNLNTTINISNPRRNTYNPLCSSKSTELKKAKSTTNFIINKNNFNKSNNLSVPNTNNNIFHQNKSYSSLEVTHASNDNNDDISGNKNLEKFMENLKEITLKINKYKSDMDNEYKGNVRGGKISPIILDNKVY